MEDALRKAQKVNGYLKRYKKAREGNRNQVGFFLACQLRDDGLSEAQAREIMLAYAKQVPKGKSPYTIQEALATVRSAYSRPPRQRAQRRTP